MQLRMCVCVVLMKFPTNFSNVFQSFRQSFPLSFGNPNANINKFEIKFISN